MLRAAGSGSAASPLLRPGELVGADGQDRAAHDRGFDERAGVDPDDRGAVVHRLEVVVARSAGIDRVHPAPRPDGHVAEVGEVRLGPKARVVGVGANAGGAASRKRWSPRCGSPRIQRRTKSELGLGVRDPRGRPDEEDEGAAVRPARPSAELAAVALGLLLEPAVEGLRPREPFYASSGMSCSSWASRLDLVPDEHPVGTTRTMPLVVRWSQLATHSTVGWPSARAST